MGVPGTKSAACAFQSTLPVWGATIHMRDKLAGALFQSTLPVWGATFSLLRGTGVNPISIHAPRVGSDHSAGILICLQRRFQSTLPVWGATKEVRKAAGLTLISIHAPRVGSDVMINALLSESDISIHAPRVGSDLPRPGGKAARHDDFNPRSPCGERLLIAS